MSTLQTPDALANELHRDSATDDFGYACLWASVGLVPLTALQMSKALHIDRALPDTADHQLNR